MYICNGCHTRNEGRFEVVHRIKSKGCSLFGYVPSALNPLHIFSYTQISVSNTGNGILDWLVIHVSVNQQTAANPCSKQPVFWNRQFLRPQLMYIPFILFRKMPFKPIALSFASHVHHFYYLLSVCQ